MKLIDNKKAQHLQATGLIAVNKGILTMSNIPFKIDSNNTLGVEDLLPQIPAEFYSQVEHGPLNRGSEELLRKISQAAENENEPKLRGLAAIGELLALGAEDVSVETVRNIGWLIESIATQMDAVRGLQDSCDYLVKKSRSQKVGVMS